MCLPKVETDFTSASVKLGITEYNIIMPYGPVMCYSSILIVFA